MAKTKQQKQQELEDLTDKLTRTKAAVFCDYTGLDVASVEELRNSLREEEVDYRVSKKTLLAKALKEAGVEGVDTKELAGQLSVAYGYKDEVMPAKLVAKFQKEHDQMKILGGIYENKFVDEAEVKKLAAVPGREELMAKLVGSINAPVSGIVSVCSGVLRNLTGVIGAIKDAKS